MSEISELKLATLWFLAARAMSAGAGALSTSRQAAAGLYAQAILGVSEDVCREAKSDDTIAALTLLDCLASLSLVSRDVGEKIMTGVMMIAYADRSMHPLEVRWASMIASALELNADDFQRCCVNARVMASMLDTQLPKESDGTISEDAEQLDS